MRKDLLAAVSAVALSSGFAFAAQAAAPVAPPVFTWTGCYVGVHAGFDWGTSHWSAYNGVDIDTSGGIAGGQAGCNYQIQNFVFGVEGEVWGSGLTGSTSFDFEGGRETLKSSSDYAGDLAARVGYAIDRTLLFGKFGVAWAHYKFSDTHSYDYEGTTYSETATGAATYSGLLLGLGVEYALDSHWSFKGEYDYINYGSKNVPLYYNGGLAYRTDIRNIENIIKLGANYRF
jgi:outer membrane immunogenic protein